ncbi:GGDEF domain-containing protein [Metabacillus litoralis]|uniref:GGDEF domain-containing protein n=1 Tax=Metabacillus litoralis TaxID=152268 RepID=UPI001CFEBA46|nr:GGDEF domain-containing protein [Metabacillus litoralis]
MVNQLNKFEEVKRKLYLLILPIIVSALVISLFYNDEYHQFNNTVLPLLAIVYSVSWFFVYRRKWFQYVELLNVALISVIHLLKVYDIVYYDMVIGKNIATGNATLWTPLVFALIIVSIKGKIGVVYSFALWCLTVTIGFIYWNDIPNYANESLIQYFLSNLVYFIFLFFSRHIISAYTKAEMLEKIAYEDSLTEISNRRKVYLLLDEAIEMKKEFSVVFFDLDHFKRINDEHGHLVGDKVLIEVSSLVQGILKDTDHFGRWGGEEFIILTFNRNKKESIDLAERLRKKIEAHHFPEVDNVTASFGIAVSHNKDTAESIINRVDEALYVAKSSGRNQVRFN